MAHILNASTNHCILEACHVFEQIEYIKKANVYGAESFHVSETACQSFVATIFRGFSNFGKTDDATGEPKRWDVWNPWSMPPIPFSVDTLKEAGHKHFCLTTFTRDGFWKRVLTKGRKGHYRDLLHL